jgi:PAS domain-containing protein
VAGAAALAAGLLALLWMTMRMPVGAMQLGCFVALSGAIGVTALSIHPVRAATLGFGAGLVLMLGILSGVGIALGVALVFLGCLALVAHRLARIDHDLALDRVDEASEGRLAVKMIAEFEGHGTGWFWEADRHGRVTYISAKVAGELTPTGASPIGLLLTDLFRMDGNTPGTERTLAFHLSSRTSFSDYSVCAAIDPDGKRWWSISGRPLVDEIGRFQGFIGSGSDLTEKRKSEAEITRLALFDGLTGDGALILRLASGERRVIYAGDVFLI